LPLIAIKRGKIPTQAKKPRSNFGKESTRRRDERRIKEKAMRCRKYLEAIRRLYHMGYD
jgi:hypothetical protein